jgi:hypothetical protein
LTNSPAKGPDECPKEQIDCPNTQIVSPFIHGVLNLAAEKVRHDAVMTDIQILG